MRDDLDPARGIFNGIALALIILACIAGLVYVGVLLAKKGLL